MSAWEYITCNWGSPNWTAIPAWVRAELNLHPALGMCGGMLITRVGAGGLTEFINKLNRAR